MIEVKHNDTVLRAFILFVQSSRAAMKYANSIFYRKANLSAIKFMALQALANNRGPMTASALAEWTSTKRHNITTLVDRLEQNGLVRAERNDKDKRFINITLTDRGEEVFNQAKPIAREIVNQVMLSLSEDDARLLEKLLGALMQNVQHGMEGVAKQDSPQPG